MKIREAIDAITLRDWIVATVISALLLALFTSGYLLGKTIALAEPTEAAR